MNTLRNRALVAIMFASLLVLSGCWTYSLHPLCGDDDPNLTYEPALEGTWKSGDDNLLLAITGDSKSQEYRLQLVEDDASKGESDAKTGRQSTYTGHLVKLGAERFLDAVPDGDAVAGALPAHNVFKVSVQGGSLSLSPLNDDFLCSAPEAEQAALGQCIHGDFILTASTAVLQDFVRDHSDDDGVFPVIDDDDSLRRVEKQGSTE